jgi:hypothetical protein
MVNAASGTAQQIASAPLNQGTVNLRVDMDFTNRTDKATFFYSLDGSSWTAIGNTLQMSYTMPHFMGYRFGLFIMGTSSAGGYADFDHFKIGKAYNNTIAFPVTTPPVPQGPFDSSAIMKIPGKIEAENYDVGGEGKAFHDDDSQNSGAVYRQDGVDITGDEASGYKVGWTVAGEWMEYTVNIEKAGIYKWEASVSAGGDGSSFSVLLDSSLEVTDTVVIETTGSWDTYATISGTTPELPAGKHILKISTIGAFYNLDWLRFSEPTTDLKQIRRVNISKPNILNFDLLGRLR